MSIRFLHAYAVFPLPWKMRTCWPEARTAIRAYALRQSRSWQEPNVVTMTLTGMVLHDRIVRGESVDNPATDERRDVAVVLHKFLNLRRARPSKHRIGSPAGRTDVEMVLPAVLKSHMYLCRGGSLATGRRRPHCVASGGLRDQLHVILPCGVIRVLNEVSAHSLKANWRAT